MEMLAQGPEFRPTYNMCHTTCLAMVHCGRVQPACDLLRGMGALLGTEPSVITVTAVITALCKQARRRGLRTAQAAYSLWRDLHGRCERPGDAAHAGEGPAHLDAPAMRAGMQACALAGRMREAEEVLLQLRAAGGVDVRAFNILCSGYAGLRDLEAVQGMLARMAEAGVEPSDVTFNTLVAAYTRLGRMDLARESLQRLKESAGGKLSRQHCWAYSALIKGHVEQGDMEGVEATLEEMRSCGVAPGRVTYGTLVDGYVKARDLSRAEAVVREAHEQGVKLTAREYNPLLWGHCQPNAIGDDSGEVRAHGGVEKALRLLQEMQDQGVEATAETYNILMHGFMKDGDPHGSISLFESMCRVRIQPDAISYTCAVRALTESGDYQGAEAMFKRALEDATIEVDERLLCTMMHCYARAGAMSRAEKLMGRLDDLDARRRPSGAAWQRTKLKAFAILIGGYCNVQDVDKALDATKRLYEDGLEPDDAIFSQLMDLFVRTGEWRRALQVVGAMERVGVAADKKRIRELFLRIHTREEHERRRTGELIRDGDAGGARSKCRELERFKFWLGMPNDYYETDWAW
ncbi:unnamed protein product [Pedinophyceae sp. YPF-701]|nr:unnamed protein product [Pedinophyceae sp. YPF-701]